MRFLYFKDDEHLPDEKWHVRTLIARTISQRNFFAVSTLCVLDALFSSFAAQIDKSREKRRQMSWIEEGVELSSLENSH